MQKKIGKIITIGMILFLLSVEFSEIVNFIYVVPFVLPFFLFLSSTETELHSVTLNYSIPFIFGLISDFIVWKNLFILCLFYPLVTYFIYYLVIKLRIPKQPIFLIITLAYAGTIYALNFPLWISIFIMGTGFLTWKIFSFVCYRFLSGKDNGQT